MKKVRLDKLLLDLGYFDSENAAFGAILAGDVLINDERITKAGFQIDPSKEYAIRVKSLPFVSRGGLKLKKALDCFDVAIEGRVCFDAGASSGGFTDCLLQNGAKFVYAVDVAYGQIDWKIRSDARVKTIERTNLRICGVEDVYAPAEPLADLLVSDLSFISLTSVLPNLKKMLTPDWHEMICLIKPQFEADKEFVEKGGVVRDKNVHKIVIKKIMDFAAELGYYTRNLAVSPIKGPAGNVEYLIHLSTNGETPLDVTIDEVVFG